MSNNYDKIAPVYDFLGRFVFGKSLIRAQEQMLHAILPGSNVLIVGGGTGWILKRMESLVGGQLTIDYLESSQKMIDLASKNVHGKNSVHFIHQRLEDFTTNNRYQVILTAFFFDNFNADKLPIIFEKLDRLLLPGGRWLFADFQLRATDNKLLHRLLLKGMYLFFKVTCQIETTRLVDTAPLFKSHSYDMQSEYLQYGGFIRSVIFTKTF